jgi:hypothetical protein
VVSSWPYWCAWGAAWRTNKSTSRESPSPSALVRFRFTFSALPIQLTEASHTRFGIAAAPTPQRSLPQVPVMVAAKATRAKPSTPHVLGIERLRFEVPFTRARSEETVKGVHQGGGSTDSAKWLMVCCAKAVAGREQKAYSKQRWGNHGGTEDCCGAGSDRRTRRRDGQGNPQ